MITEQTPIELRAKKSSQLSWRMRLLVGAFFAFAVVVVWVSNLFLTERFTESTRNRGELRLALYSGNLLSELRRNAIVPQLLARDPALIGALQSGDFSQSSQRLISYDDEIGAANIFMLDSDGRTVASTDRNMISTSMRSERFFIDAIRSNDTLFSAGNPDVVTPRFTWSRRMEQGDQTVGVIVVEVDLHKFQTAWAGISDAVFVTDSEGTILLATEPRWRGLQEADALEVQSVPSALTRAFQATVDWAEPPDAWLEGAAVLRLEARLPFQGWRIASFTSFASVRERVNGFLAIEIMGFAMLLTLTFYLMSRRTTGKLRMFQQESAELRALNSQLQREIAERERVEKNLKTAEQTLAQSSKLAALGEMSAAVSHELNQPLAAMKTYLAGARLLLQRKRPEEAMSSFYRIDDLIERMGAITRQLKSYARKSKETFEPIDSRVCVNAALEMMEPQLKQRQIEIKSGLPRDPAMVLADPLRLEQVLINLLRNAVDATKFTSEPRIEIVLSAGHQVTLTIRDNGEGIEDLESLFEPFYTTKEPGDGVGLGLAISSGIAADFGGRLTAHNSAEGGAVFVLHLPTLGAETSATAPAQDKS
ncbi:sensor histidine kinase [Halocynthiibacter styelae]|uniref:C4-dicarboxylate transport sensor protein DctB n=1 Tax=Halocynthiibacter styelae TaxID=2761955 RepID=A0A8J7LKK3_9RHOB|nr:ATP-binding protein [Paenihalocynthiibacter styelae]MBI1494180.1 sensor histidine kinase [Paenihalocynthiibacter styelae]